MKKAIGLALLSVVFLSCSQNVEYVKKEDFRLLKKKVDKNRFAVKQALSADVEIKDAFKEVNHQLRKQNQINKKLFIELERLRDEIQSVRKITKELKENFKKKKSRKIGIVLPVELNLRRFPYVTPTNVIKRLKQGEEVEVLAPVGEWYKVKAGSDIGYVHRDYLKVIER